MLRISIEGAAMYKKILGATICTLFLFYLVNVEVHASNQSTSKYKDVTSSYWAYQEIMFVTSNQYMTGTSTDYFSPNLNITRAEAVLAIARSLNKDTKSNFKPIFKDVKQSDLYYNAVCQLVDLGVIQNAEYFHPNEPLKRSQVAKMLALAYDIEVDQMNKINFNDVSKTHWAKNYIESLADVGIIKGVDGKNFAPERNITRVQLAVLINRVLDFRLQIEKRLVIYDYLSKGYISTANYSNQWVTEVIGLINKERQRENLMPLVEDKFLSQIAVVKAQDMIQRNYFNHVSPYYGQPWDLAAVFDYSFRSFGENIAKNFSSPSSVVTAWLKSPSHRANIMRPQYTNIGVGVKKTTDGNFYWVQMFASK